jgi:hypothetical protein
MSEADLQRFRNDLDTIQHAPSLELPFGWTEVKLALTLIPCGLIISLWSAFGPRDYDWLGVVPLVLVSLASAVWAIRNRAQFLGTPGRRRENTFDAILSVVLAVGMAGLIVWEKQLGLPSVAVRGAAMFLLGLMLIPLALTSRTRRSGLGVSFALIPYGLVYPLCTRSQAGVVGGLAVIAAGLAASAIMAYQLRADRSFHEPATH